MKHPENMIFINSVARDHTDYNYEEIRQIVRCPVEFKAMLQRVLKSPEDQQNLRMCLWAGSMLLNMRCDELEAGGWSPQSQQQSSTQGSTTNE